MSYIIIKRPKPIDGRKRQIVVHSAPEEYTELSEAQEEARRLARNFIEFDYIVMEAVWQYGAKVQLEERNLR